MWTDETRPSARLEAVLSGHVAWDDAPAGIQSWARFAFYEAACEILKAQGKTARRNMLLRIPPSMRPHVEAEAKRLWALRR